MPKPSVNSVVLDASAVLALLQNEPGADAVLASLAGATISAVNLSEVVARLADREVPAEDIRRAVAHLGLRVEPFDADAAYRAGMLRPQTRPLGLSLGDRACLALANALGVAALTADRQWRELALGIEIRSIR